MTIATYADLQAAIGNWLARAELTAPIPDFIMLFETVANRRLRLRQQESTVTLTPSSGAATLPADYLAWRRLTWTGASPRELDYAHPSYLRALFATGAPGAPRLFTIEGASLTVRPASDTAHGFVKDTDSLMLWAGRRDAVFDELERLDAKTRGPAAIRVTGATP